VARRPSNAPVQPLKCFRFITVCQTRVPQPKMETRFKSSKLLDLLKMLGKSKKTHPNGGLMVIYHGRIRKTSPYTNPRTQNVGCSRKKNTVSLGPIGMDKRQLPTKLGFNQITATRISSHKSLYICFLLCFCLAFRGFPKGDQNIFEGQGPPENKGPRTSNKHQGAPC